MNELKAYRVFYYDGRVEIAYLTEDQKIVLLANSEKIRRIERARNIDP
jgi:hypothetical protein